MNDFGLAAIGMQGTLPSGCHQDFAVSIGMGQVVKCGTDAVQTDLTGDHRRDVDIAVLLQHRAVGRKSTQFQPVARHALRREGGELPSDT